MTKNNIDENHLKECLKLANCDDFIDKFINNSKNKNINRIIIIIINLKVKPHIMFAFVHLGGI